MRLCLEVLEARVLLAANAYTVNALGDAGAGNGLFGDLRYCVNQAMANPGSTISIQVAKNATIQLTSTLTINQNVSIVNPSNAAVAGSGNANNLFSDFTVLAGATVNMNGLTIQGGYQTTGGGIANAGNLTLSGVTLQDNVATNGGGGGIANAQGGSLTLQNDTIQFNSAVNGGGGGVYNVGTLQTGNTETTKIIANDASTNGGGLYNVGTATFNGGGDTFSGNTASGVGGGIYNGIGATFTLTSGNIYNNDANKGGGLYNLGTTMLNGVAVQGNSANQGAGIYLSQISTITFNKVTVQKNNLVGNNPVAKGVGFLKGATMNGLGTLNDLDDPGGNPVQV